MTTWWAWTLLVIALTVLAVFVGALIWNAYDVGRGRRTR